MASDYSSVRQFVIPYAAFILAGAAFMQSGLANGRAGDIWVAAAAWSGAAFLVAWHFKIRSQRKSVREAAAGAFALLLGSAMLLGLATGQFAAGYHGATMIVIGAVLLLLARRARTRECSG